MRHQWDASKKIKYLILGSRLSVILCPPISYVYWNSNGFVWDINSFELDGYKRG